MADMALNIEQRLGQKLTSEQQLLWNEVLLIMGNNCVITPYYYAGLSAGTDLIVSAANKIFVCYELQLGGSPGASLTAPVCVMYDRTPAAKGYFHNHSLIWDATAAAVKYGFNKLDIKNTWFSYVGLTSYVSVIFNGFRVTV